MMVIDTNDHNNNEMNVYPVESY